MTEMSISVPEDPPNNVTFQKIPDEVTKFQVTFVPPSEPNGNIQVYQAMVYNEDDPAAIRIHNLSVIDKTDQSVTAMIEGLKGGHTYNVSVRINTFSLGFSPDMIEKLKNTELSQIQDFNTECIGV